jgi:hypothetical protein
MITCNFNYQTQILETKYYGDITLEQIVNYINETSGNRNFPRELKILTDASNAHMTFGPFDIDAIVEANNNSLKNYNSITDALIVTNPNETALTFFFQQLSTNDKYKINAFSTKEAAVHWLEQNK